MTVKKVPETKEILSELKALGKNLTANVNAALKSEQRKVVEGDIKKGLKIFTDGVDQIIKDFKKGEVDNKVRKGVHEGLKEANTTLKKTLKTWKPVKKSK